MLQKRDAPAPGQITGVLIEAGTFWASEAMSGLIIEEDLDFRPVCANFLNVTWRNRRIFSAEMELRRAVRGCVTMVGNTATIPSHGGIKVVRPCRSKPGDEAAPAEADNTDWAVIIILSQFLSAGFQILLDQIWRNAASKFQPFLQACLVVRQNRVGFDAVKEGRGENMEALLSQIRADVPDVSGQAKNFLHDDNGACGLGGARLPCLEFVAVCRREADHVALGLFLGMLVVH